MRAAVVAVIVLVLLVAAIALVAVDGAVNASGEPAASQISEDSPLPTPTDPAAVQATPCPSLGDGIELTGCPNVRDQWVPSIGIGDLRRLERLPPQGG